MQPNSPKPAGKAGRPPSQRQLRVGEVIRHALAELLQRGDVHDPVFAGTVVTIPEVRMAPDLKCATVFVMPLGGKDGPAIVEAFERHKKFLRGEVARRVNLRSAPDLRFRIDTSFDEGARVDAVLRSPKVVRDLGADQDNDNNRPASDDKVDGGDGQP
ncbi:MAG TPA: 30S ribosome-binding factor RbfA [Polyangiaceae bacterium]